MKTLAIIGSTGSIGKAALSVLGKNKKKFNLVYLAANTNLKKLNLQNAKYKPKHIFLLNEKKNHYRHYKKNFLTIEDALSPNQKKIDYVISGVSSYDAISVNLKLLKIAKNLLIANKETIICGGNFFLNIAKKNNCKLYQLTQSIIV
jgi:1-deoxy-D-xylulose-5-phosphate reductoisomerase